MHDQFLRAANIALTVREMFEQLAVLVHIPARRLNRAMRLHRQEACISTTGGYLETEGRAARDDDVIAFVIGQQAKVRIERAMPLVYKVNQVGIAVAIEVIHRHGRDRKSTRLNSSHVSISYAVFCLKKKKKKSIRHYSE